MLDCKKGTIANNIVLAIPVYNEQKYLDAVLDKVSGYIDSVMVIDDGSIDGSKEILAKRGDICFVSHPENRGYGQSIIDAFHLANAHNYQWVITMDCDLQHEPEQIPCFLSAIRDDDADIISGSRYLNTTTNGSTPPTDRRSINRVITQMINERLSFELTDAFCGFKAYRVDSVMKLDLTETGYAFPLEFWACAAKASLRIRELPVSLIYNDPNRYFGGELDDADLRLMHYKEVFEQAIEQAGDR